MAHTQDAICSRLNAALQAADITQSKLAQLVGASQPAVSQWLAGKKAPSGENWMPWPSTRVNRDWLTTGAGRMKSADPEADRVEYQTHGIGTPSCPQDGGRDFGNTNVWSFDPGLDVLVREVLQNARDAALTHERKVDVVFRIIRLASATSKRTWQL